MAEVFAHEDDDDGGDKRNGGDGENRSFKLRDAEPCGFSDAAEVDRRAAKSEAVRKNGVDRVGEREADENQKLLNESARINGNAAHADHREDGNPGVKVRRTHALDGSRREVEADDRDDGAGNDRRHQPFDPFDAGAHDDEAHGAVNEAADDDAAERHGNVGIRS